MKFKVILFNVLLVIPFVLNAQEVDDSDRNAKIFPQIYIGFETGQIVKGRYQGETVDHLWLGNVVGRAGLKATPWDWLSMVVDVEGRMWFNTFPMSKISDQLQPVDYYYSFYLWQVQGMLTFINTDQVSLGMNLGVFPYKYNPEVRVLGEYLFRSGTYPAYLINHFDYPMARLSGLNIGFGLKSSAEVSGNSLIGVNMDALALTEREMRPFHDFTLAGNVSVNVLNMVTIGAGLSGSHLFSVDDSLTTPKDYSNLYDIDTNGFAIDTLGDTVWNTEEHYYTFKGGKFMLRGTLDPFAFLRTRDGFLGDFLGANGGKIYGELAILGIKDYPAHEQNNPFGYDKVNEKMPKMFGFTIPCWKILDVLAFEFEHFECPYPNNYDKVYRYGQPLPEQTSIGSEYDSTVYLEEDNWKWIVYMKKSFTDNFGLICQIGRDHQRWEVAGSHWRNFDFEEILVKRKDGDEMGHWAWHFKTEIKF